MSGDRRAAEGDHKPTVGSRDAHVAITRQAPRGLDRLAPGLALVAAEHHEAPVTMAVFPQQAAKLLAVGRAKAVRLAGIASFDLRDHDRLAPREPAVGGAAGEHLERGAILAARPAVVEPERAAVLQSHDARESHHAAKAEGWHLPPARPVVVAHDRGHPASLGSAAFAGRKKPEPAGAVGSLEAIDARAVPVVAEGRRERVVEPGPGLAAVSGFGHRSRVAAVAHAPDSEDLDHPCRIAGD
jgi:hypothetical protein